MKDLVFLATHERHHDLDDSEGTGGILLFLGVAAVLAAVVALAVGKVPLPPVVQAHYLSGKCVAVQDSHTGDNLGCEWIERNPRARFSVQWVAKPAKPNAPSIKG